MNKTKEEKVNYTAFFIIAMVLIPIMSLLVFIAIDRVAGVEYMSKTYPMSFLVIAILALLSPASLFILATFSFIQMVRYLKNWEKTPSRLKKLQERIYTARR